MYNRKKHKIFLLSLFILSNVFINSALSLMTNNPLFLDNLETSPNYLVKNTPLQKKLWPLCDKHAFDSLYVKAEKSMLTEQKNLSSFISNAHKNDLQVILNCGQPDWSYKHYYPLITIEKYINYNEGHRKEEQFDAILLKVNPEKLHNWNSKKILIKEKFFEMLTKVKHKLNYSGLRIPLIITLTSELENQYQGRSIDKAIHPNNSYYYLIIDKDQALNITKKKL